MWTAAALLSACGSHPNGGTNTSDAGNQAPPGCSPGDGAGNIKVTVEGVVVSNTCFESMLSPIGTSGVTMAINSLSSASTYGTQSQGIAISFSSTCTYSTGQTLQLSDPCIEAGFVLDGSGLGSLPPTPFLGLANTCVPDDATSCAAVPGCVAACVYTQPPSTALTAGSLTITKWSVTPGDTVSVSISGTLTGFVLHGSATSAFTDTYVSIPISGTATATINN